MTDNLKWSSGQIVTFLDVYRKYECLWDVTSPDYLKREVKREAYTELVNELDLVGLTATEDCLKKKIKNLRDAYRHELNKVKKSKKSGASADKVHKPKLAWFTAADAFWNSVTSGRDSTSNLVSKIFTI